MPCRFIASQNRLNKLIVFNIEFSVLFFLLYDGMFLSQFIICDQTILSQSFNCNLELYYIFIYDVGQYYPSILIVTWNNIIYLFMTWDNIIPVFFVTRDNNSHTLFVTWTNSSQPINCDNALHSPKLFLLTETILSLSILCDLG